MPYGLKLEPEKCKIVEKHFDTTIMKCNNFKKENVYFLLTWRPFYCRNILLSALRSLCNSEVCWIIRPFRLDYSNIRPFGSNVYIEGMKRQLKLRHLDTIVVSCCHFLNANVHYQLNYVLK